ncbi:MAG: hypothetical protein JWR77_971 [Rhizorhabdus sp.]|nr:hypothetical protein [Rhizorhabdus sp.]
MGRGEPEQESIGELFARLIDDARALAKAELAMFRLDFYQRISRAKAGILMCVLGAIMGQAAAVVSLISIAYALTPWLGGFGGAAVAALVGAVLAGVLIKLGAKRLLLIVDDDHDDQKSAGIKAPTVTMEELFDRARAHTREARAQLADAVGDAQNRLNPQTLALDLWEEALDHAQGFAHKAVDMVRYRPLRSIVAVAAVTALLLKSPISHLVGKALAATRSRGASLKDRTSDMARSPADEETTS